MAENKIGPNIGAGAGIFAKRVQKSLNRAQEKVSNLSVVFTVMHRRFILNIFHFWLCVEQTNKQILHPFAF